MVGGGQWDYKKIFTLYTKSRSFPDSGVPKFQAFCRPGMEISKTNPGFLVAVINNTTGVR